MLTFLVRLLVPQGGGKPDSFQGVGSETSKVEEAKSVATESFRKVFSA